MTEAIGNLAQEENLVWWQILVRYNTWSSGARTFETSSAIDLWTTFFFGFWRAWCCALGCLCFDGGFGGLLAF